MLLFGCVFGSVRYFYILGFRVLIYKMGIILVCFKWFGIGVAWFLVWSKCLVNGIVLVVLVVVVIMG